MTVLMKCSIHSHRDRCHAEKLKISTFRNALSLINAKSAELFRLVLDCEKGHVSYQLNVRLLSGNSIKQDINCKNKKTGYC